MRLPSGNNAYKWLLRLGYIWIFISGIGLLSFGIDTLIESGKLTEKDELNNLMSIGSIFFGTIIIIVGFYRKSEIEQFITKSNL